MLVSLTSLDHRIIIAMIFSYLIVLFLGMRLGTAWLYDHINTAMLFIGAICLIGLVVLILYVATMAFGLPIETFYQALFWMFRR